MDINQSTLCPKCKSPMEEGFVQDLMHGNIRMPSTWIAGQPERSFWTGTKTKGKEHRQIRTYRCTKCGYLESYAG